MKWKNLFWLFALAGLWGPSFLFIKVAVEDFPPLTLVFGRLALGAVILWTALRLKKRRLPRSRQVWRHLAVMALVQNAFPFVMFAWGEQHIDSALASILNGMTPMFTILLAHFFVDDDRLNLPKFLGVVFGFGGLVLLVAPAILDGMTSTVWGLMAVVLAATSYGVALVYSRLHLRGLPPLVAPAGQMIAASLYLLPVSLIFERPYTLPTPSLASLGSLVALGVFG
ncbi:MAG: DMT family transporter, partial [Anaerolineae bacterium]